MRWVDRFNAARRGDEETGPYFVPEYVDSEVSTTVPETIPARVLREVVDITRQLQESGVPLMGWQRLTLAQALVEYGQSLRSLRRLEVGSRRRALHRFRQRVMLGLRCWGLSYADIGRVLGRDHSTVIHAVRQADQRGLALPEHWRRE